MLSSCLFNLHAACVCACVCARARACARTHARLLSCVQLCAPPWTGAHQAPLFMEFFSHEYWNGLPFLPPVDLLDPGLNPCLLHWQLDYLPVSHLRSPICKGHHAKYQDNHKSESKLPGEILTTSDIQIIPL